MNGGRYPDNVVNEAVERINEGADPKDVADELREKYGYERLHSKTLKRWHKNFPMGKQPESLPPRLKDEVRELVREYTSHREPGNPIREEADHEPALELLAAAGSPANSHEHLVTERRVSETDSELGPHGREMFYFCKLLRDRLIEPNLVQMVESPREAKLGLFWEGDDIDSSSPYNPEESAVAKDWGHSQTNAHWHPLFPLCEQHLEVGPSLQLLDDAEREYEVCVMACQKLGSAMAKRITTDLFGLSSYELQALVLSLLMDTGQKLAGYGGLNFSYRAVRRGPPGIEGLPVTWTLKLGKWNVCNFDHQQALIPIAEMHEQLVKVIPRWGTYQRVAAAYRTVLQVIDEFKKSLSPDPRLRRLLRSSRCSECPRTVLSAFKINTWGVANALTKLTYVAILDP